jgi:hypothetical protein
VAIAWEQGSLPLGPSDEKRYGSAIFSLVERMDPAARQAVWLLERKAFRRAIKRVLPSGHGIVEVRESTPQGRVDAASRAYERLLSALGEVPELPATLRGRLLVWGSWVSKPRGQLLLPGGAIEGDASELRELVCQLWARAYLASNLERLPEGLKRAELAIAVLEVEAHPEWTEAIWSVAEPPAPTTGEIVPPPGLAVAHQELCTLEESLMRGWASAWRPALRLLAPIPEKFIVIGGGELGLTEDTRGRLFAAAPSKMAQAALALLVASEPVKQLDGPPRLRALWSDLREWLNPAAVLARSSSEVPGLLRATDALRGRVAERLAWVREMDFALLPDDGLRTTLEDACDLSQRTAQIAAEAAVAAAIHSVAYSEVTGVEVTALEGGLHLAMTKLLSDFEEALACVRFDSALCQALVSDQPLPRGPGTRAVEAFCEKYPEIAGISSASRWSRAVERGVRAGLGAPFDIESALGRSRADADRIVARFEEHHSRVRGAAVAPLRTQARSLIVLREQARYMEVQVSWMLGRVLEDVDRRLSRLEPGLRRGAAYFATIEELIRFIDLRGSALRPRVEWRRAEWDGAGEGSREASLLGLGHLRRLGSALLLPYQGFPTGYRGRLSDTLPALARSLGIATGELPR